MKFKAIVLSLLACAPAYAATLNPEKGVEILFINGVEIDNEREAQDVKPGDTQLVLKYSNKLGSGNSGKVFDSSPFVVSFEMPEQDVNIVPPTVHSYETAKRKFKNNPEWVLNTSGSEVAYQQEKLPTQSGLLPNWKLDEQLAEYNAERGLVFGEGAALVAATQTVQTPAVAKTAEATATKPQVSQVAISNLEQLQGWYLKASKEERKEFRKWMIDQE